MQKVLAIFFHIPTTTTTSTHTHTHNIYTRTHKPYLNFPSSKAQKEYLKNR